MWSLPVLVAHLAVAAPPPADDLMARYECQRCHEGTGAPDAPRSKDCVGCHEDILSGRFDAPTKVLSEWRSTVRSLTAVPSLAGLGRLFRRDWVQAFLLDPYDVRPDSVATMPRLAMSEADAARFAELMVPHSDPGAGPPNDPALVDRGRVIYGRMGCYHCHDFSAAGIPRSARSPYVRRGRPSPAATLAPDLRYARDRLQPGALAAWIENPRALRPDTLMPAMGLKASQARAVAAFILHAPLAAAAAPSPPLAPMPLLKRRVRFGEVADRVFKKVCWHCHSSPDSARGDGGPGNTGGFGFAARGLDLSSYQGVAAGVLDADGERSSVFAPGPDGIPRLVRVLYARHEEVAGRAVPGARGMPLGFPPLAPADIQLVASWVAQGRPR